MLVLGIETSCDETSVAIVRDGTEILGSKTYSQIKDHKKFGGVVPEIASRIHVKVLHPLLESLLDETSVSLKDIDLLAATSCPGLIGALLVGVSFGNALACSLDKPIVGIHHLEGHIYSAFMMKAETRPRFPAVALVVSGGHTMLIKMDGIGKYSVLGQTLDDAVGEAFDKIAKIMDLPYPGGPVIDRLSKEGNPEAFSFPRALIGEPDRLEFSFSGLKTSVLYEVKGKNLSAPAAKLSEVRTRDIAASAQRAIVDILVNKTRNAILQTQAKSLIVCGGVAANSELKRAMNDLGQASGISVFIPPLSLCTDNATMVAGLGFHKRKHAKKYISEVFPNREITD